MTKVLLPICTLIWGVNTYGSRQRNLKIGEMKVLLGLYQLSPSSIVLNIELFAFLTETFSFTIRGDCHFYKKQNVNSVFTTDTNFSFSSMATLRNKRKLAEKHSETPENTKKTQSRNTIDPEITQEYFTQVSEEIEGRVTKKLSKEFSRTESRVLGALPKLEKFLVKPHVRTCSVAVPGTSRNSNSENRELSGDRSLDDPCPEVRYSSHHSSNINSPDLEDYPHVVTVSTEDFRHYPHMVTGGPEEIQNRPHMTTGILEEFPFWSPGTFSGKQKKARSTSQPQFRSENTRATIEAD